MEQPKNHPPLLARSSLRTLAAPRRLSIHPESNQIRSHAQFLLAKLTAYAFWKLKMLSYPQPTVDYGRDGQLTDQVHKPAIQSISSIWNDALAVHSHSQSIYPTLPHIGGLSPTLPIHCLAVRSHKQRKEKHIVDIRPSNLPKRSWKGCIQLTLKHDTLPLYSRKLHIRVRRARTS